MTNEYDLGQNSTGKNSVLLRVFAVGLIFVMVILTLLFLPESQGTILNCQEAYPSNGPFTFVVTLGGDEYWHVKSWTDTPETNYNVTLRGHTVEEESEGLNSENSSFTCRWGLSLNSSGAYNSHEFKTRLPSSSNKKWIFKLLLNGHGSIHITITKFDRHSFHKFFVPDLVCGFILFSLLIFAVSENEFDEAEMGPIRLVLVNVKPFSFGLSRR